MASTDALDVTSPLRWSGTCSWTKADFTSRMPELLRDDPRRADVPMFRPAVTLLEELAETERQRRQAALLGRMDHIYAYSLFLGVLGSAHAHWLRRELALALAASLRFLKLALSAPPDQVPELEALRRQLRGEDPAMASYLETVLRTSLLHHQAHQPHPRAYGVFDRLPFYLECGGDVMMGAHGPVLSEFQVAYQGYPHAEQMVQAAYAATLPELFDGYALRLDDFTERRGRQLEAAIGLLAGRTPPSRVGRVVVDAWSQPGHENGSHAPLAAALGAELLYFDHQKRSENRYAALRKGFDKLFVFNQPGVCFLDPEAPHCAAYNAEEIEVYPELGWRGVIDDYFAGRTLLSVPPPADILNDKAFYPLVRPLVRFFFERDLELPVADARPLWDPEDPRRPNRAVFGWALEHQEQAVIAHRYLEGGMGIRVGAYLEPAAYRAFLEQQVARRPSLFVLRGFYPMAPVHSLRAYLSALIAPGAGQLETRVEVSDLFCGRITLERSVDNTAAGGQCFDAWESRLPGYSEAYDRQLGELRRQHPAGGPTRVPV
ncbi:MAG: hypothetical protein IT371_00870 [Deltaproteobacteria bacterium]|nr:hypothetical protein [Deltaproteobacteria bacterium]